MEYLGKDYSTLYDLKNDSDYLVIQKDDYIIETLNKKNE